MPNLGKAISDFHMLEQLAERKTAIHALHPLAKLFTSFVYIVCVISYNKYDINGLAAYAFYPAVLMALSETPYKPLLQRLWIAIPFSLFAGISNLIFDRSTAFFIGNIGVSFGVLTFLSIMLKTAFTVMSVLILVSTTKISQLSNQLINFKIPPVIVLQLTMTYRYISVLIEEASSMYTAYMLRSPKQKGIKMGDMGLFVGQLLLRSVDRAERIYYAMKCKGYQGTYGCSSNDKVKTKDIVYVVLVCAALILLRFINFSNLIGNLVS